MVQDKDIGGALKRIEDHWERKATAHEDDNLKVDTTRRAQSMRFESFVVSHDLDKHSLLDVGCGVGEFWGHLLRRQIACDYLGVDISASMIKRSRERFPDVAFETRDILQWDPGHRFDFVVSFGIHNVKVDGAWDLLSRVTRRQFELCDKAAHVALLTDRFSGFGSHAQPWPPERVLEMCLEITPYVVLRHDYLPNDFSVTLYREPLIDTRSDLFLDD